MREGLRAEEVSTVMGNLTIVSDEPMVRNQRGQIRKD